MSFPLEIVLLLKCVFFKTNILYTVQVERLLRRNYTTNNNKNNKSMKWNEEANKKNGGQQRRKGERNTFFREKRKGLFLNHCRRRRPRYIDRTSAARLRGTSQVTFFCCCCCKYSFLLARSLALYDVFSTWYISKLTYRDIQEDLSVKLV